MFAGPSGIGKTTLAKWVSEELNIPFISGSMSDILPETKDVPHIKMMDKSPTDLYNQNWQVLNLRNKLFNDKDHFVTDRSFLDVAAYSWLELDKHLQECDLEHLIKTSLQLMEEHCDLLIVLPLTLNSIGDWVMEDNGKRILNKYFQVKVSLLMTELVKQVQVPYMVIFSLNEQIRKDKIRNMLVCKRS